jgi:hypothetical protein
MYSDPSSGMVIFTKGLRYTNHQGVGQSSASISYVLNLIFVVKLVCFDLAACILCIPEMGLLGLQAQQWQARLTWKPEISLCRWHLLLQFQGKLKDKG